MNPFYKKKSEQNGLNFRNYFIGNVLDEARPSINRIRELREQRVNDRELLHNFNFVVDSLTKVKSCVEDLNETQRISVKNTFQSCSCIMAPDSQLFPRNSQLSGHLIDILNVPTHMSKKYCQQTKEHPPNLKPLGGVSSSGDRRMDALIHDYTAQKRNDGSPNDSFNAAMKDVRHRVHTFHKYMTSRVNKWLQSFSFWIISFVYRRTMKSITILETQLENLTLIQKMGWPVVYVSSTQDDYIPLFLILRRFNLPIPSFASHGETQNFMSRILLRSFGSMIIDERRLRIEKFSQAGGLYHSVVQALEENLLIRNTHFALTTEGCLTNEVLLDNIMRAYQDGIITEAVFISVSVSCDRSLAFLGRMSESKFAIVELVRNIADLIRCAFISNGMVRVTLGQPVFLSSFVQSLSIPFEQRTLSLPHGSTDNGVPSAMELRCLATNRMTDHMQYLSSKTQPLMITNLLAFTFMTQYRGPVSLPELTSSIHFLCEMPDISVAFSGVYSQVIRYGYRHLSQFLRVTQPSKDETLIEPILTTRNCLILAEYAAPVKHHLALKAVMACAFARCVGFVPESTYDGPVTIPECVLMRQITRLIEILNQEAVFFPSCQDVKKAVNSEQFWWKEMMTNCEQIRDIWYADLHSESVCKRLFWLSRVWGPSIEAYRLTAVLVLGTIALVPMLESRFIRLVYNQLKRRNNDKLLFYSECISKRMIGNCIQTMASMNLLQKVDLPDASTIFLSDFDGVKALIGDLDGFLIL